MTFTLHMAFTLHEGISLNQGFLENDLKRKTFLPRKSNLNLENSFTRGKLNARANLTCCTTNLPHSSNPQTLRHSHSSDTHTAQTLTQLTQHINSSAHQRISSSIYQSVDLKPLRSYSLLGGPRSSTRGRRATDVMRRMIRDAHTHRTMMTIRGA